MLRGCFSCSWGGLRGSWGHLGAQSRIFINFDSSLINFCTPLAPCWGPFCRHVGYFATKFGCILLTCLEEAAASIFGGFLGVSKPSFFEPRRGENAILSFWSTSMLASLLASKTSQNGGQDGPKRFPWGSQVDVKNDVRKKCEKSSCEPSRVIATNGVGWPL